MYEVFAYLRHEIECLAAGFQPLSRHDRKPWKMPYDRLRKMAAGTPLGFRACLLYIKMDMAELVPWGAARTQFYESLHILLRKLG